MSSQRDPPPSPLYPVPPHHTSQHAPTQQALSASLTGRRHRRELFRQGGGGGVEYATRRSFLVHLTGAADPKAGVNAPEVVYGTITEASPNTDGTYAVEYFPKTAGEYVLNVRHRQCNCLRS